jgi:hypothetical protein
MQYNEANWPIWEQRNMSVVTKAHFGIPRRADSAKVEEPAAVNWRRGLFRVWLLFCAAWMMGWTIYLIIFGLHGGFKTTGDFLVIPVLLFGPPIALLLFGLATRWAIRGFKAENSRPGE